MADQLSSINTKATPLEEQLCYFTTRSRGDKEVVTFPKITSLKVNLMARLKFELAYYDIEVQHASHNHMRAPSLIRTLSSSLARSLWVK